MPRGDPPATRDACAADAGVTRERIRQLTLQVGVVRAGWVWAPEPDAALHLDGIHKHAHLLYRRGVTERLWHPESVNALTQMCGRDERVAVRATRRRRT